MLRWLTGQENYGNPHGVDYTLDGKDSSLLTCVHPRDHGGYVTIYLDSRVVPQFVRLFSLRSLSQFLSLSPARLQRIFDEQGPAKLFVCADGAYDILEFRWQEGLLIAYDIAERIGVVAYDPCCVENLIAYTERYFAESIPLQKQEIIVGAERTR